MKVEPDPPHNHNSNSDFEVVTVTESEKASGKFRMAVPKRAAAKMKFKAGDSVAVKVTEENGELVMKVKIVRNPFP